jgi:soluble lytic murein transglycosylase-like protein
MKRLLLIVSLILVSTSAASGQGYRADNFDFATGIRLKPSSTEIPLAKTSRSKRGGAHHSANAAASNAIIDQKMSDIRISNSLSGYTTGNGAVDSFIVDAGRRHSVDPLLLYSIMHQESTFKPRAMSHKGARGLMQLMPGTAARFGVTSIWDPKQNIEGGTRYMRWLLDKFDGNVSLALAGYNAGEGAVMKYGNRIPPYSETQEYVRRISKRYALIRDPYAASLANRVRRDQIALVQRKESAPLTMYERSVFPVRLPDGRLQLVSQ